MSLFKRKPKVNKDGTKKKSYFPSAFLVIIGMMIMFIIASWIGQAATNKIHGVGLLDTFTAIWHGFASKVDVILFIFSIGGTLGIMTRLKVIDAGIGALVNKLGDKVWLLIPVLMIIFGLGGTTYGMWEETVAFIPVLIPVFKKAGYGPFTAMLVILIGAGTGCLASTINPFAVGAAVGPIAKNVTGFNTGVMQGSRWLSFVVFEIVSISLVTWLTTRYKKASVAGYKTDAEAIKSTKGNAFKKFFSRGRVVEGLNDKVIDERFKQADNIKFTLKRKISLGLFVLAFLLMIVMYLPWGNWITPSTLASSSKSYNAHMFWFASTSSAGFAKLGDWYFVSVAALFLLVTIVIFSFNYKSFKSSEENAEEGFISSYMDGVKDVVSVTLLIGVAGGLGEILKATGFGDLIANAAAKGFDNLIAFGVGIFLISIVLSILMPSTSGFAAAFMGIFAGIAAKAFPGQAQAAAGLALLGFLFANGVVNLFTPTSAALMGYTSYAGIPYNVWIKQTWKITLVFFILALTLIIGLSAMAAGGIVF